MALRSVQAPSAVVMIRPHHFRPNAQTAADNSFQTAPDGFDEDAVARAAHDEATVAAARLADAGIRVHIFEDESRETPDSVFPNNWFSTHPGGHVAIYPMFPPNRRRERRMDVIEMLKRAYRVQEVVDYSGLEPDGLFLEGTGAMVLDHSDRVAYAVRSNRTDPVVLERFCAQFGYEPMVFDAEDRFFTPILRNPGFTFSNICIYAKHGDREQLKVS
ncbi:MAG: arginine deiminase-related protein, partial [Pseudomonadota bacterium]